MLDDQFFELSASPILQKMIREYRTLNALRREVQAGAKLNGAEWEDGYLKLPPKAAAAIRAAASAQMASDKELGRLQDLLMRLHPI